MSGLNLSIDTSQLNKLSENLRHIKNGKEKMLERSLNRAIMKSRTEASKAIRQDVHMKAKYAKRSLKVYKASMKRGYLSAAIVATGKPVPLIGFQARQTKKGVSVKVDKGESPRFYPHAFITTMNSGHRGVYQRKTRDKKGYGSVPQGKDRPDEQFAAMPKKYRLPIKEKFGPSAPNVLGRSDVMADLQNKAEQQLSIEMDRQTEYLIQKSGLRVEKL